MYFFKNQIGSAKFIFCQTAFILFAAVSTASAQNFKSDLRKLESQVKSAHKSGKLTDLEYSKLMREQEIIKQTIEKAQADDYLSPDEKNKIHSKIIRSKKRFAKYKTNREVY